MFYFISFLPLDAIFFGTDPFWNTRIRCTGSCKFWLHFIRNWYVECWCDLLRSVSIYKIPIGIATAALQVPFANNTFHEYIPFYFYFFISDCLEFRLSWGKLILKLWRMWQWLNTISTTKLSVKCPKKLWISSLNY